MPVTRSEKENISYILKNALDVQDVPVHMINDAVVKATEEALIALNNCAHKTHALGTLLKLIPTTSSPTGWLLSANKTMAMRHAISTNPDAIQTSKICMASMSHMKRAIKLAALSL